MKLNRILALSFVAVSAMVLSGCANLTKQDNSIAASNDYYLIDDGNVKILADASGKEIVALDEDFLSIAKVSSYKDKLVVMGNLDFGQAVFLIDAKKSVILDKFTCFYLSDPWAENRYALQSPSGRYMLFRKFHSPFSAEEETSNFAMIYDLEKSPSENRLNTFNDACGDIPCSSYYAGKFFYPDNKGYICSTCVDSLYKTQVYNDEDYVYVLGNKWDSAKTVLQISYPKIFTNDFLIVEETKDGLTKKLLKFSDAKIYDVEGKILEYAEFLEEDFYMVDFVLEGNTLTITNLKDSSKVGKLVFAL